MAESAGSIRAGRAYVELGADSKELEAKVKKGQSLLNDLKKGLGEESKLGNVGKILAGTGAAAGLALSARLLNDMAGAAVKWRDAMAQGGDAAAGATEELIQSLPILGQIRQAGLAIRELFTGEEAAARAVREEVDRLNKSMDARLALQKAITTATDEQIGAMGRLAAAAERSAAHPEDRWRIDAQQKRREEAAARSSDTEEKRNQVRQKAKEVIDPLLAQARAAEGRMEQLRGHLPNTSRPPLIGRDKRYDNLAEFRRLEADVQGYYQKIRAAREEANEGLRQVNSNARKIEAQEEQKYFTDMIEREREAEREAARNLEASGARRLEVVGQTLESEQVLRDQYDQDREAWFEKERRRRQEGIAQEVEGIRHRAQMKEAAGEVAEVLTFGLTGDWSKLKDTLHQAAAAAGMIPGPGISSAGTTQFGVAESLGGGPIETLVQTSKEQVRLLKRIERKEFRGLVLK